MTQYHLDQLCAFLLLANKVQHQGLKRFYAAKMQEEARRLFCALDDAARYGEAPKT